MLRSSPKITCHFLVVMPCFVEGSFPRNSQGQYLVWGQVYPVETLCKVNLDEVQRAVPQVSLYYPAQESSQCSAKLH